MNNLLAWLANSTNPVMLQLKVLGAFVAQIALAVIFLAVAVWILKLLKVVAEWLLDILQIDKLADMLGLSNIVKKVNGNGLSALVISVFYWIAMIGILISTLTILGPCKTLPKIIGYMLSNALPNILSAMFIMVVAILVAAFVSGLVKIIAGYFKIANAEVFGKAASFIVLLYAVIFAISQIDLLQPEMINTGLLIAFIGFVLAAALGSTKEAAAIVKAIFSKAVYSDEPKKVVAKKKK